MGAFLGPVSPLFGGFPVDRGLLALISVEPGDRPVACGHTYRGGGASMAVRVRANAGPEALLGEDWVFTHEMVHLGLPYVVNEDAWLSEGLATYYQEVLRARAGMQTPLEA